MSLENRSISERNRRLQQWLDRKKQTTITPAPEGIDLPLTFGQQRIYFLQELYPNNPFYHYVEIYQIAGKIDIDRLIDSFKQVMLRHESMRTTINIKNGKPVQIINPEPIITINRHSLVGLSKDQQEQQRATFIHLEATTPFDLNQGPLVRLSFIILDNETVTMILTMHHIITDQWSYGIIREEWSEAYIKGAVELKGLEIQYGDFAYWQRKQVVNTDDLTYWSNKLAGRLPILNLTLKDRPGMNSFRGKLSEQSLNSKQIELLKDHCQEMGVTMYVLMLSIYKLLLFRYSGQTDLLVGTPVNNRDQTSLEKLVGFFNETVVLRTSIDQHWTFRNLVSQVRETVFEALEHKNVPFESLVQKLKPHRFLSINPIFQVMFLYHNTPPTPDFGSELKLEYSHYDLGISKFDLTLYVLEKPNELTLTFEYSTDVFDGAIIDQMQRHLINLLNGVLHNPDKSISSYPLLEPNEQEQLVKQWNKTELELPEATTILSLIETHVQAIPMATAAVFNDQSITYDALNQQAEATARYLLSAGAKPGDFVGLYAERSIATIAGMLGILKAGLVYVPIDPGYPLERIQYILTDANIRMVLTPGNSQFPSFIEAQSVPMEEAVLYPVLKSENGNRENPEGFAYLIYTSGSTGKPKGVPVSHENLLNSTYARIHYYPNLPRAFLLLSSFSFDSSIAGIFWTLCTGGTLVLSEHRIEQDMDRLAELMQKHQISHTLLLPSLYKLLLEHADKALLGSLDTVVVAGEACRPEICDLHFTSLPEVNLYNEYGPTETTVWSTVYQLNPMDCGTRIPIGRPIANTKAYILDSDLQPVPPGIAGELYIGGKGVAEGYLNRPDQTILRFVSDTFQEEPGSLMYRTGDLCSFRADGVIEYHGRVDNQIKVRGYRIEPAEVQETINKFPAVRDSLVVQKPRLNNWKIQEVKDDPESLEKILSQMDPGSAEKLLRSVELLTKGDG